MNAGILYFSITIIATCVSIVGVSIKGNYISRTFNGMSPDVVARATFPIAINGRYKVYFKKEILENDVKEYLNSNLKGKIDSYQIGFLFLNLVNDEYKVTYDEFPTVVEIRFKCIYSTLFNFDSTINFSAKGVYNYEWKIDWLHWK